MASNLDLQEQEQLDELKAFWNQWGNLITGVLTLVLGGYAAWSGWNLYQGQQGAKASVLYGELERAAQAGDAEKATKVFESLKSSFGRTAAAQQGGLVAAKTQFDKGQLDPALASLEWVAAQGHDAHAALARLRMSAIHLDRKAYDQALKVLEGIEAEEFAGLVWDRKGDVLKAQGKADEAAAAWKKAFEKLPADSDYRRIVEAKLMTTGALAGEAAASGAKS